MIQTADITWQTDSLGNITPSSEQFDDIYFSKAGGFDETNHVFLQGNDLPHRFANLGEHEHFVIMETGFGTGLNFLATCLLWQQTAPPSARLYFVSTEKYPLSHADLTTALSAWQDEQTTPFIKDLLDNYPLALTGCHRLHFGNITLDLWLGDALDSFCKISDGLADAWFLDGFAPAKNSELWSDEIFGQIKRLSRPNATLATFTSSGAVRRALTAIDMSVQKIKGFGRKREMITATFDGNATPKPTPKSAIIIGAGVSGLFTAHALARRGVAVSVIDKTAPLAGASGNPKALFAPKLTQLSDAPNHLPTVSFLYAERIYKAFNQSSNDEIFSQTGAIDFLLPTQKSHEKLAHLANSYPDELIGIFNENFNSDNADFNHQIINTHTPKAGLIDTHKLADFILSNPLIHFKQFHAKHITKDNDTWTAKDDNRELSADIVVICAGFESYLLNDELFNPRKIRGQVSWLDIRHISDELKAKIATPIKYDGYCATFDKGDTPTFLMGASFVRNDTDTSVRDDEHEFNLAKLRQSLPSLADELNINTKDLHGRASIRAQTPDYHPLVGEIGGQVGGEMGNQGLYTVYGMGSKGFSFAPICGEILAGLIFDEPLPVSHILLDKLNPNRPRLQTPIDQNR
ncbi:tRNA 5-methylaminomethyl-2-thiouridine biosynthesis bifunctional protein MnmC [Moraxella lacunata]|uniref:tRNA 5-methylaminomethyl-2-thiouridine biosynthesis bifunctional protein MnmC n=1 Tax=Moraxella lacunata TaxID=477 RepID=A0A378TSR0_MORLA|nr:FAD-dependent 5-carboxymethylaminomethyl-2-thiouridine(34) oxidoreductase MnmC [Moraxella lacunata]STZ63681.1 tRNA 5-methylaminomethyl-2-thiouridine biosynthesis bifunctional protein MnmC [Moraxella lacunata]